MKNIAKKSIGYTVLYFSVLMCLGCNKVDANYDEMVGRPQVSRSDSPAFSIRDEYPDAGYKAAYIVGDTATWTGRFFLDNGMPEIRIGNAEAKIIHHQEIPAPTINSDMLNELVRFVITEEMGIGEEIPVTITANGASVFAPNITINQFIGLEGEPDSTLVVDKLATWQPDNPEDYYIPEEDRPRFNEEGALPWINRASVTESNIIYVDNSLGVFRINSNGSVENWIQAGESFEEDDESFSIRYVISSTVNKDHTAVYVSTQVIEGSPENSENHIFRLLKINPVDKKVETLNRTLIPKDPTDPNVVANPAQGAITEMPLIAMRLTWSPSGLYFANATLVESVKDDNTLKNYLYNLITNDSGVERGGINTLCRMDITTGQVQAIMHSGDNTSIGIEIENAYNYRLKPDGSLLYTVPAGVPNFGFGILYYDVNIGQIVFTKSVDQYDSSMRFVSFDTVPETRHENRFVRTNTIQVGTAYSSDNWTVNPAGEVVSYFSDNFRSYPSLFAAKIDASKLYCYAGTELGLFNDRDENCVAAPGQIQETGLAKWVEFAEQDCSIPTNNSIEPKFIGTDPQGVIYFHKFSSVVNQEYSPIRFYKLYPGN